MYGHWEKQTRKFNKHYQRAGRGQAVPLWDVAIGTFGGAVSAGARLSMDKEGIWPTGTSIRGSYHLPLLNLSNHSGDIFPLMWFNLNGLQINGSSIPTLSQITGSGNIKSKYETITIDYTFGGVQYSRNVNALLIYVDMVDLPTQEIKGQTFTVPTLYRNMKFNQPFRVPKSTPLIFNVVRDNLNLQYYDGSQYLYDGLGSVDLTQAILYDSAHDVVYHPPSEIGSSVSLNRTVTLGQGIQTYLTDITGGYGVMINNLAYPLANPSGVSPDGTNKDAIYDSTMIFRTTSNIGSGSGDRVHVYASDFDTDLLKSNGNNTVVLSGWNTANGSEVIAWQ